MQVSVLAGEGLVVVGDGGAVAKVVPSLSDWQGSIFYLYLC